MTMPPVRSVLVTSYPANLSSPGLKGFSICFMASLLRPSARTESTKPAPTDRSPSTARSFATATVIPGGLKLACETQLASMAEDASSLVVVSTQSEPTMRPTARSVPELANAAAAPAPSRLLRFFCLSTICARSMPDSSQICSISIVGLNLQRMGSKAKVKPLSLSAECIMSIASPLQPKLPNTPQGFSLAFVPSFRIAPSASCTGVGMCPPSVGLPRAKPLHLSRTSTTSEAPASSQLRLSTPTPALARPLEIACASEVVFPYAEA
mmetsp:Transcript_26053/g.61989  ORF Transcript_26053/g.61989 Transcript_26053/m.61989 type:complete len:267 (-) Transcript_26053:1250-2050(-)